jgi:hypothetical protein
LDLFLLINYKRIVNPLLVSDCCPEPVLAKPKRKMEINIAFFHKENSQEQSVFPMPAPVLLLQVPTVFGKSVIPGAVLRHLDEAGAPPTRVASFHEYYNQGPWEVRAHGRNIALLTDCPESVLANDWFGLIVVQIVCQDRLRTSVKRNPDQIIPWYIYIDRCITRNAMLFSAAGWVTPPA